MKEKIGYFSLLFGTGAILYPLLEILFRGFTHISMSLLGGICLVLIGFIDLAAGKLRTVWKAFLAAVMITQLEFIFGLVLNRSLSLGVWDYSHLPLQFEGQISLLFSTIWFFLSYLVLSVFRRARKVRFKKQRNGFAVS